MEWYSDIRETSVQAEVATPLGSASIVRARWKSPIDMTIRGDIYHLQLSLLATQLDSRACFPESWGPNRFEPIGSLFLTPAQHVVRAMSNCQEQQSIVCTFNTAALERWFGDDFDWTARRLAASLNIGDTEIRRLLLRIGSELREPGYASASLIELLVGQLAIELARYLREIEAPSQSGGLAPWRLRLIDDYLADHPATTSLADLAQECRLSVRQLSRGFKASRGRTLGTYIGEQKMKRARQLLASGALVKNVASELGFSSPSNFCSAFQRDAGESPRQFQVRSRRH